MASSSSDTDTTTSWTSQLKKWLIIGGVIVVIALILSALLPRWWSQQIGNIIQGRVIFGWGVGIAFGFLFTTLPVLALSGARRFWANTRWLGVVMLVVALVLALPNLMTLWVSSGASASARAGQTVLTVQGPGFRAGTMIGFVLAVVLIAVLAWRAWQKERREAKIQAGKDHQRKAIQEMTADTDDAASDAPSTTNGASGTGADGEASS